MSANKKCMSDGSENESDDTSYIYKASCKILEAWNIVAEISVTKNFVHDCIGKILSCQQTGSVCPMDLKMIPMIHHTYIKLHAKY